MNIADLLKPEAIRISIRSRKKKDAIDEMAQVLAALPAVEDEKALRKALAAREKMGGTAVGSGVAIPHGKCDHVTEVCAAIGIAPEGIDWDAPDAEPVRILVALAGPPGQPAEHLRLLSQVARLLGQKEIRENLLFSLIALEHWSIDLKQ